MVRRVLNMQDPIALDSKEFEPCLLQLLSGHSLDWISPNLVDVHVVSNSRAIPEQPNE
jgi:hypothetical protein